MNKVFAESGGGGSLKSKTIGCWLKKMELIVQSIIINSFAKLMIKGVLRLEHNE